MNRRKVSDNVFAMWCLLSTSAGVVMLIILLVSLFQNGAERLDPILWQNMPSRRPARAGALSAIVGSLWVMFLTGFIAVPLGIGAALYLEEYQRNKNRFVRFIQLNISNLAGVPSIVYGLLGLALFVRWMQMGSSIIAAAMTMALLILPMVIIVTQEALRAVPQAYREGSLALGASEWQTISRQVLPNAFPGILTGIILALSRAIGETAPLIVVGAASFINRLPDGLGSSFTVLPIQIFNWTSDANQQFHKLAGSAIIILMTTLLLMNSVAITLRYRARKKLA
jgi:phosphate transport system permease protein